jgi:hypothetical protein
MKPSVSVSLLPLSRGGGWNPASAPYYHWRIRMADDQIPAPAADPRIPISHKIVHNGEQTFGKKVFTDASQALANTLGARANDFMTVACFFPDQAPDVIMKLSDNERRSQAINRMSQAEMVQEFGRISAEIDPYGGAEKCPIQADGTIKPEDFRRTGGHGLPDSLFERSWKESELDKKKFRR